MMKRIAAKNKKSDSNFDSFELYIEIMFALFMFID
jgi:hypothetical protein